MPVGRPLPIPFILDLGHLALDDVVSFCIAVLFAVTVSTAGQAFMAIILGAPTPAGSKRLAVNPLFCVDLGGAICFLLGGFGWPRQITVDLSRLPHPRLYGVLIRFAGPVANFLLANIAASVVWLYGKFEFDSRVFAILAAVNVATAIYNVLPIPPLAMGSLVQTALGEKLGVGVPAIYCLVGPYLLIAILLLERLKGWKIVSGVLNPAVKAVYVLIMA